MITSKTNINIFMEISRAYASICNGLNIDLITLICYIYTKPLGQHLFNTNTLARISQ